MYRIENLTAAPVEFALLVPQEETMEGGVKRTLLVAGDKMDQKNASDNTAWSIKWSDDLVRPSAVKVTDAQYEALAKQPAFSALLAASVVRAHKE